ncbi:MAG: sodium-dependent transporter [Lachnospiraceae bacterium]|nr:sodium-dependent transporter [Lachnospiraceae bacterium]
MSKDSTKNTKENFGSKLGFILAAAGSAVGLGNIWRFPYLAAKDGGGIFLLVYIILAITFGFSLMITEISIGRKTGKTVITAYKSIDKKFGFLGPIAAVVPFIITPYYCVIGGWVLRYFVQFVSGKGVEAANDGFFSDFIGGFGSPVAFFVIYAVLTAAVVIFGVQKGIEKISKIMMPALIVLTIGIAVYTMTIPGALDGVKYYILPNFKGFTFKQLLLTIVDAMGQLFYSMSLAMGIMVTYGSYMRKEDSLEGSVRQIEVFDTAVAFLAGLIIIPGVFAFSGGDPSALNAGPSLMFITLPQVFKSMFGGQIVGTLFFLLVTLAALTSSISLLETMVSIVSEKFKLNRYISTAICVGFVFVIGMTSVLGYGIWSDVTIFGYQFLDFYDFISNNVIMPIVALLTCILIGYFAKTKWVEDEVEGNGRKFGAKGLYRVMVLVVCPICMIIILLTPLITKFLEG